MENKTSLKKLLPVFLAFYAMGFVDLVGVATGYVKKDFQLSDSLAQLLPSMVFIWFLVMSIPTGIFQDRKGKKLTVMLGISITAVGLVIPFAWYSFPTALIGFVFIGIGNTILQVSANPLLIDISGKGGNASNLTLSQFVKAIASMMGPILIAGLVTTTGNWRLIFPLYIIISILSVLWLRFTSIEESRPDKAPASFSSVLALLKKPAVLIGFIATFLIVGFDVGINSNISTYLSSKYQISLEAASFGISIYFAALMVGRLLSFILLKYIRPGTFLFINLVITLIGLTGLLVSNDLLMARAMIFVAGLGFASIFPIIFALIVDQMPDYANELSSLIILSVSGGALIPPVIGLLTENVSNSAVIYILMFCMIYVALASLFLVRKKTS
jgi:MFS transporter, FHS family, L-fucose permease